MDDSDIMPPPLIGRGINRCFCLTFVCLSVAYIGPKSRTERPKKTKIGTEIAHVTRDSDTTFKVKGQGHQAALLSSALTCKAAAAVSVGTYSAWESTATFCSGAREALGRPRGRGAGHIVSPRAQLVVIDQQSSSYSCCTVHLRLYAISFD